MSIDRPFSLVDAAKFGAYAGIAAVLIALVGMIEAFSKRMIIADVISMAQVMLLAVAFVGAMFAASKAQRTNRGLAVPAGIDRRRHHCALRGRPCLVDRAAQSAQHFRQCYPSTRKAADAV